MPVILCLGVAALASVVGAGWIVWMGERDYRRPPPRSGVVGWQVRAGAFFKQ